MLQYSIPKRKTAQNRLQEHSKGYPLVTPSEDENQRQVLDVSTRIWQTHRYRNVTAQFL